VEGPGPWSYDLTHGAPSWPYASWWIRQVAHVAEADRYSGLAK
jgi:hypothetical protein